MIKLHIIIIEVISHVLIDDFRICRDYRAVEMIRRSAVFDSLIVYRRIEDALNAVLDEPFDVPVNDLSRVACCIGGYGIHTALIHFLVC